MVNLEATYTRLSTGNPEVRPEERGYMVQKATQWVQNRSIPPNEAQEVYTLVKVCNTIYNYVPNHPAVIPDELYDSLVILCRRLGVPIPVGAPPIRFNSVDTCRQPLGRKGIVRDENGRIEIVKVVPDLDKRLFFQQVSTNSTPPMPEDFLVYADPILVKKKQRTVGHKWDMCGTLDKCKFVLVADAMEHGAAYDPSVGIFERDFLSRHCQEGILDPRHIELVLSLKYDGISVENTMDGPIVVDSCTRGDLDANEASDLTPIFGGMEFARARSIDRGQPFGVKFEYLVTWDSLARIQRDFGKAYVNPRNGVIGLTGGLDARRYRDYLTPVPLESSLQIDRLSEIQFLNQHYTKGLDFRYVVVKGDYNQALFMVKRFVEETESLREYMGFTYDGVVVEYADARVRAALGKRGSVPRYSIAIKFPPLKRTSTFLYYTYSVGQDGIVTPKAHFKPVEFMGQIHDKTTAHSYERFKSLGLHVGDKVVLTLNNDAIVYIRRAPQDQQDASNRNPLIEFPTHCPSCGQPLYVSESEASAFCANFWCPERSIARLSNTLSKLSVKGFSTETVRALGATRLSQLYSYTQEELEAKLGPVNAANFTSALTTLKNAGFPDHRLIGAIGFTGIAEKTWKTILEQFPIERVLKEPDDAFMHLKAIPGIGDRTVETIVKERPFFLQELQFVFSTFRFTRTPLYNPNVAPKVKVCFTGTRDKQLAEALNRTGLYDADVNAGFTKATGLLIVPYVGYMQGSKVTKAFQQLGVAYGKRFNVPPLKVDWNNLQMCTGLAPAIVTVDQAYAIVQDQLLHHH